MSPIKNIYMHFSSLPDPLKSPTLEIFQIFFFLFSYWDWKSAPKKKPKKPKSEVGIISIFWKGRFLIFLNYFWMFIAGLFFFCLFLKLFLFLIYTRRLDVYLQGEGSSWRCGGEREGGEILKSFPIKLQWIPVFGSLG